MAEYYFSTALSNNRTLCIAPLSNNLIERSGQSVPDPSGYFLFERHHDDALGRIEIIAQLLSVDAVFRLRDQFRMT